MLFCRVAAAPYPAHRCVIRRPGKRSATRQLNLVRANMIRVENVHKTFVLHQQHGVRLPVLADASLTVTPGSAWCSTVTPAAANRPCCVRCTPIICRTAAYPYPPRRRMGGPGHRHPTQGAGSAQNHHRLGQPVSAGDPAHFGAGGGDAAAARSWDAARSERRESRPAPDPPQRSDACGTLRRPPFPAASSSGSTSPAVLRSTIPILLLDEPTASLDDKNSAAVVNLIHDAKARGAAIVGIFHDEGVRRQVADRLHSMGMTA